MDARQPLLTARGCAEQSSAGSRGVVQGHVRRVVDGHPPGRRDGFGSGFLAVRGHLRFGYNQLKLSDVTQEHEASHDEKPPKQNTVGLTTQQSHAAPVSCVALAQADKQTKKRLLADK